MIDLKGLKLSQEEIAKLALVIGAELGAIEGQVKNVDGALALGINEGHFEIAAVLRENRGDLVEQARVILGGYFHQRGMGRTEIVETDLRGN